MATAKANQTAATEAAEAYTDAAEQPAKPGKGIQVSAVIPQKTFDKANRLRFKLEIENRGDLLRAAVTEFVEKHEHLLTDAS